MTCSDGMCGAEDCSDCHPENFFGEDEREPDDDWDDRVDLNAEVDW